MQIWLGWGLSLYLHLKMGMTPKDSSEGQKTKPSKTQWAYSTSLFTELMQCFGPPKQSHLGGRQV